MKKENKNKITNETNNISINWQRIKEYQLISNYKQYHQIIIIFSKSILMLK